MESSAIFESRMKKVLTWILILLLVASAAVGWVGYQISKSKNQVTHPKWIYINKNDNYSDIKYLLNSTFQFPRLFHWLAGEMNLPSHIYPGRYLVAPNMSMLDVIRMLRSANSVPVKIRVRTEWSREELVQVFSDSLSCSKDEILSALSALATTDSIFSTESVWCIFIADTYFFNWHTEGEELVNRMRREVNEVFRKAGSHETNLNVAEVCILATIVQGETYRNEEMPTIAGLYLNRLRIHMPLQADPTIKFALKRDSVRRITMRDLEVNSPYNTYKRTGLPPGPISFPSRKAIQAVIQAPKHRFLYMCAKEDFSGYHRFASNYSEHLQNARKYQRALNNQKIYQ